MRPDRRTGLALLAVVVVGALARLYRLTERTFTHPEMFLPYRDLPVWATSPPAYDTLSEIVTMAVEIDVHPPGFWTFMWGWLGLGGTDLFWIRIPLVIAGVVAILLTYRLGRLDGGPAVGLIAAALLAVNGQHVFHSQIGRKYGLLVMLALASLLLLRRLRERGDLLSRIGYPAVTAWGLWTAHVFWFFLGGQVLWALADGLRRGRFPRVLASQGAAAIAAAPGLFYMGHQWGRATYLEPSPGPYLHELLMFGGLFDRQRLLEGAAHPAVVAGVVALTLAGAACLVAGLRVGPRAPDRWAPGPGEEPGPRALVRDPVVALAVPAAFFAWNWTVVGRAASQLATLAVVALVIPALPALRRAWPAAAPRWLRRWIAGAAADPIAFHLLAVAGAMSLVSIVASPLAASRTLLFLGPLALVVMARPLARLASTAWRRVALGALVAAVGALAVVHVETRPDAETDAGALAERMVPRMRAGDVVVLRDAWWSQPMHYHLPPGSVRAIRPEDLRRLMDETREDPAARPDRLWLVAFGDAPWLDRRAAELDAIPTGYRRIRTVDAHNARATLYERLSPSGEPADPPQNEQQG